MPSLRSQRSSSAARHSQRLLGRHTRLTLWIPLLVVITTSHAEDVRVTLSFQTETSPDSGRFHRLTREETWSPEQTAIIVCDVWDLHHCRNAVRRVEEFAPRLNDVLTQARQLGMTIIHSPSDCMPAYANHPARQRALAAQQALRIPPDAADWCSSLPREERAVYPIDQSDGGEDDDPEEHARWQEHLRKLGRNPATPWREQSPLVTIDPARDFISDNGAEVWNILQQAGIRNVILTGVHLNMCVLGRPFGLRQMARNGFHVVLMRDMTDTMYNPARWPWVNHFAGTDLMVSHVERFVCPTITSDQIIGGQPFAFALDQRPHLVMVIAEDEYETNRTLPAYAVSNLLTSFRVTTCFGSDERRHEIPGLEAVDNADILLVSVRRRALPAAMMDRIRAHARAGKPIVGVRTASHAFDTGNRPAPEDHAQWKEFDAQIFGGNYHGHHGNDLPSSVQLVAEALDHPASAGLPFERFAQGGSLYKTSPLAEGTRVLLIGHVAGHPAEPVAWTFERPGGGRSFYTSLGHPADFDSVEFCRLLTNGIHWATDLPVLDTVKALQPADFTSSWTTVPVPASLTRASGGVLREHRGPVWYRCAAKIPSDWARSGLTLSTDSVGAAARVWVNGEPATPQKRDAGTVVFKPDPSALFMDDTNLFVIRLEGVSENGGLTTAPVLRAGSHQLSLAGLWQVRVDDDPAWASLPLPAKFGASADMVFTPPGALFVPRALTRPHEFTPGIEGPACDRQGNIFAVNYARQGTIGRVTPDGTGHVFVELPTGSVGNGIRFGASGEMYVADYTGHNILKIDPRSKDISVLAHEGRMNQPNDLAIGPDGTLYASDPDWKNGTGQLWRIDADGTTTRLAADMGTTNGIEVSPDGKTLYVNESVQRNIWAFRITLDKSLTDKKLVRRFDDHGFDGMRCDVDGNLYVTRYGKGTVVKLSPDGEILREVSVLGARPSNLCFGGPDGCTVYVTEVESGRLVSFRVDRPGQSWRWQQDQGRE